MNKTVILYNHNVSVFTIIALVKLKDIIHPVQSGEIEYRGYSQNNFTYVIVELIPSYTFSNYRPTPASGLASVPFYFTAVTYPVLAIVIIGAVIQLLAAPQYRIIQALLMPAVSTDRISPYNYVHRIRHRHYMRH